jgi:hypothetical protein
VNNKEDVEESDEELDDSIGLQDNKLVVTDAVQMIISLDE